MNINSTIKLLAWIVFFEIIGFCLGLVTQANLFPWYQNLNKSSLTPPGFVFSIVWSLLYALLAVIAWMLSNPNKISSKRVRYLFVLQLLINWAWTPLFFWLHNLVLSAFFLITLVCLNLILIIEAKQTHKTIFWLLIPYFIWLIFACYLNGVIVLLN